MKKLAERKLSYDYKKYSLKNKQTIFGIMFRIEEKNTQRFPLYLSLNTVPYSWLQQYLF